MDARAESGAEVVATVVVCRSVDQRSRVEKVTTTDSSTGYAFGTFR
jgi:hypothetical protein